ncbi:hypothetical protein FOCC_FOCC009659 [Frankliniella occidentalis]|nr:hypothetical protein FOCC_FOCC009659 [Frankliniella occidentalis]
MARPTTRASEVRVPVLATPACDFSGRQLPTLGEVLSCYVFLREELRREAGCSAQHTIVTARVTEKLLTIWGSKRLPTVSNQRIDQMITKHYNELMALHAYPKNKRQDSYEKRVVALQSASQKLFDICSCKCVLNPDGTGCRCVAAGRERTNIVAAVDRPFLVDQRGDRNFLIGREDKARTAKETKRAERTLRKRQLEEDTKASLSSFDSKSSSPPKKSRHDEEYVPPTPRGALRNGKNFAPLTNTAATAERFNVSNRAAAAVASAYAVDMGLVSASDRFAVVDPSKLQRQRALVSDTENRRAAEDAGAPVSIYFDGRKNTTLVTEKIAGTSKSRTVTKKENHVVILVEPASKFVGHVVPDGTLASSEASAILRGLENRGIPTHNIKAAGCDGTSYNTGADAGVLACLERELQRPLQRNLCLLHANELPSRRLVETLDGPTSGPMKFTGPIGKLLERCEEMAVVRFQRIPVDLPPLDVEILSWEQKHLYNLCQAISTGNCPPEVAAKNCGKLYHGRWTTTNSRVLRLYIGTARPSATLKTLTQYIVKVYAVMWFTIRREPLATSGPLHIMKHISLSRFLPKKARDIVFHSLAINCYYAHPENILLSMVVDERQRVREVAVQRILEARHAVRSGRKRLRRFTVPKLNYSARDYVDLIDWDTTPITPPPLLADLTDSEIQDMVTTIPALPQLPCHTQAVERKVHDVTQAASRVAGERRRDGRVNAAVTARKTMPKFNSKSKFKAPYEQ